MKINTENIAALNQTAAGSSGKSEISGDFQKILDGELAASQSGQGVTQSAGLGQGIAELATLIKTSGAGSVNESTQAEQTVMDNMESILNEWENYAGQIGSSSGADLRQAYSTLENIENGVQKLKTDVSSLSSGADKLSPLVNELEVMTTTEKIKFNRGDYI